YRWEPSTFPATQDLVNLDVLGLEGLAQNRDARIRMGLAAHEYIDRRVAGIRPSMYRNVALGQHGHARHPIRVEMMQVDVQEGGLGRGDATAQRRIDQVDVVKTGRTAQIDDQVHAGATNAVSSCKMVVALFGLHGLDYRNVCDFLGGCP